MPLRDLPVLPDSGPVKVRHIKRGSSGDAGAISIDGAYFTPQFRDGVNGEQGWQKGDYERRLIEEAIMNLTLPNIVGGDGVYHRDRFAYFADKGYHPGDEWLELYRNDTKLIYVGTPIDGSLSRGRVELKLADALELEKYERETAAGFWCHAPRDVFEHYTRRWTAPFADGFDTPGRFSLSTSPQVTADGLWTYTNVDENSSRTGTVRARPPAASVGSAILDANNSSVVNHSPTAAWRVEATFELGTNAAPPNTWSVQLQMWAASTSKRIHLYTDSTGFSQILADMPSTTSTENIRQPAPTGTFRLAIEKRDRWLFFYINGRLQSILLAPQTTVGYRPRLLFGGTVGVDVQMYASSILVRQTQPLLQRGGIGGDLRLPGQPGSDNGLTGEYYDDAALWAAQTGVSVPDIVMKPVREPYSRRIDTTIGFSNGSAWWPPGPAANDKFSVRWTGAIYIDLDNYDYAFRFDCDDRMRMWIGRTRFGEEYLADWTVGGHAAPVTTYGNWLKAGNISQISGGSPSGSSGILNGEKTGWYPIVIEYNCAGGALTAKARLDYLRSDDANNWSGVTAGGALRLSPLGILKAQVRFDSHYEQLQAVNRDFGYQYTVEPRQLESGSFPGRCDPMIRVGRDTDKVLDSLEGVEPVNQSNATDVLDTLVADAAGLATEDSGQLTYENIDFTQNLMNRFMLLSDYQSLADITFQGLLLQRANRLQELRKSPWEEVSVRTPGRRELRDSFPLSGALAEFDWLPGEGIRLDLPEVRVQDTTPRQITGCGRPFVPLGVGVPSLSFRQRPRSFRQQLRQLSRSAVLSDRNYQGQMVDRVGNVAAMPTSAALPDNASRVSPPEDIDDLAKALVVVQNRGGVTTTGWTILVNGNSTGIVVNQHMTVDITTYLLRDGLLKRAYVQLTGGTGSVEYQLIIRMRV